MLVVLVLLYDINEQNEHKRTCNITFISPVFNIKKVSQINHVNPVWVLSPNCSDKNIFCFCWLLWVLLAEVQLFKAPCLRGNVKTPQRGEKTSQLPGANGLQFVWSYWTVS